MIDQTVLGRTGLKVSIVCIGTGGLTRLGQKSGASFEDSVGVLKAAVERGITFIDTAAHYKTEPMVAAAIKGIRDKVVISTKTRIVTHNGGEAEGFVSPAELTRSVEQSLKNLQTDYVDIFHFHGVSPQQYRYCVDELLPELQRLRAAGKVRFFALTERFNADTTHEMLGVATRDDHWDVVMVGFNFINQTARSEVLANTRQQNIGTMCMFPVRWGLASRDNAAQMIDELVKRGEIDLTEIDIADPLGFLKEDGRRIPVTEAAYRFCRHTPGIDVVMTGTANVAHLDENIRSLQMPPLPPPVVAKLERVFGNVRSVTGNPLTGGGD